MWTGLETCGVTMSRRILASPLDLVLCSRVLDLVLTVVSLGVLCLIVKFYCHREMTITVFNNVLILENIKYVRKSIVYVT